jgi:Flp pilus assembly protein TadG
VGNSRGARKLARTPHVNQKKKKKKESIQAIINESINALTVMLKKTSETNLTGAV